MTLAGIRMRVVGRDATPMRGPRRHRHVLRDRHAQHRPGESYDVIFTAPAALRRPGAYDTYCLYNRAYPRSNNLAAGGFGGAGHRDPRLRERRRRRRPYPNDWGI